MYERDECNRMNGLAFWLFFLVTMGGMIFATGQQADRKRAEIQADVLQQCESPKEN